MMAEATAYTETEERIFEAALTVFARKGKDGARMQEIADEAAINKAMLHYYFRSKDQLYEAVFDYVFRRFMESFGAAIQGASGFEEMLRTFIDRYIEFVQAHRRVVRLMVNEQLAGGAVMQQRLGSIFRSGIAPPQLFAQRVEEAVARGEIRPVDPFQTLLTVVSGCLFSFIAAPMVDLLIPAAAEDEAAFIEQRKAHLFDVLYHGLRLPPST